MIEGMRKDQASTTATIICVDFNAQSTSIYDQQASIQRMWFESYISICFLFYYYMVHKDKSGNSLHEFSPSSLFVQ